MGSEASTRRREGIRSLLCLALATLPLILGGPAAAATPLVTPQQLTVTAANATGDSIYNLPLTTTATTALISGTLALNTDGAKHGAFDALVWVPNSASGTLDLIVADATHQQILRYAGPNYGTSTVLFTYAGKGSGPAYPTGLAADGAGNVFVISPSSTFLATPMVWVLPFKSTTGTYGTPVLIDQTFSGVRTLALADVTVATSPATAVGGAAPAWAAGDLLVLVGDTFNSRLIVYSKSAITGLLANPKTALTGPSATVISSAKFLSQLAAPFGFDVWPADASHGVSVLVTTIDGRILRWDTRTAAFTTNFASGLGLGLTKMKVGTFAGTPYAFVAQLGLPTKGQILQFGAPPASGANKPVATITKGVSDPIGIALMSSGSTPASACVAPQTCSPLGPQITTQISGPGAANIPPGATILEQACTIPTDPRVAVVNGQWSCLGPTINVCGATPTPGCVPATLDVANYCPGFPSTILPATMCGHAGASGAGLVVVKASAALLDSNANDLYIQTGVDATIALPGPYDPVCQAGMGQYGPLVAWAPRSDLPTVEGTIVEDQSAPYFADFTGFCDKSGTNTHVESMFAYGLGLNAGANGLGTGQGAGLGGFINTKFNNLQTMIHDAAPQILAPNVTTTLENYVTQSQAYFNSDYTNDVNNYSCALNSIASGDAYLRNQVNTTPGNFHYQGPAGGNNNPNPAGEIDGRFANLFESISGDFLFMPNPVWPTANVPPCVTLSISTQSGAAPAVGGSATLTFGPPTPMFSSTPLIDSPSSCTLSATDGTYKTAQSVPTTGSVSTGTLTKSGTYTATLECAGPGGDSATSFTTATTTVSSTPTLQTVTVSPPNPTVVAGNGQQFTASGSSASGSPITLGSVTWQTNNGNANITSGGLATCLQQGQSLITATSGGVSGSTTLTCSPAVLTSIAVSPANASLAMDTTQQYTATGTDSLGHMFVINNASWTSSTNVASITQNGGLATCMAVGNTVITANSAGVTGSTGLHCNGPVLGSITVTPTTVSTPSGTTQQFTANGFDTGGQPMSLNSVQWSSSNAGAPIDAFSGLATCNQQVSTTITATSGNVQGTAQLTCTAAGSITLTPEPGIAQVYQSTTLYWSSSNLLAGETCALTSNSSDAPLNQQGLATSGHLTVSEDVAQAVTFTISCTGPQTVSAQAPVLWTLRTTYRYTGIQFPVGNAYADYVNQNDRVLAAVTVDVPLAPNLSGASINDMPGFTMTLSDGQQTLTKQNSTGQYTQVWTDANGNPTSWAISNYTESTGVSSQGGPALADTDPDTGQVISLNEVDLGYLNANSLCDNAPNPVGPSDCGAIADDPGNWASANVLFNLEVIVGTTSTYTSTTGVNPPPPAGQLYQVYVGGSLTAPTLTATTLVSQTPEPKACAGGSGTIGNAAAVTSLAWVGYDPQASGYIDLVAANNGAGDEWLLSGPSYQPTTDVANSSSGCSNTGTGPAAVAIAADVNTGTIVGAGHDASNAQMPALYVFRDDSGNTSSTAANFVLMDYPNSDTSLTACNISVYQAGGQNTGCVTNLVDAAVVPFIDSTVQAVKESDMLVLVGDAYSGNLTNPVVLRIPAAAVNAAANYSANCLAAYGGTATPCTTNSGGNALLKQADLPLQEGEVPVSIDIYSADSSLFIATNLGNIYQLTLNATATAYGTPTLFAAASPGIQQVRVASNQGNRYVFATIHGGTFDQVVVFAGNVTPAGGFTMSSPGVAVTSVNGAVAGLAAH